MRPLPYTGRRLRPSRVSRPHGLDGLWVTSANAACLSLHFTVTTSFIFGWIPHKTLKVPGTEKTIFVLLPGC
jgi:hypothetical protein